MQKVDSLPMYFDMSLPDANEIWFLQMREVRQAKKTVAEICKQELNKSPVFVFNDDSLMGYFIGVK